MEPNPNAGSYYDGPPRREQEPEVDRNSVAELIKRATAEAEEALDVSMPDRSSCHALQSIALSLSAIAKMLNEGQNEITVNVSR